MDSFMVNSFIENHKMTSFLNESRHVPYNEEQALRLYCNHVIHEYTNIYYASKVWHFSKYRGYPVLKFPNDMWIFQEIITELKPDLIIETGSFHGGTALYFADLLELLGNGEVISIDIELKDNMPTHDRLTFIEGSSVSDEILNILRDETVGKQTVMVDLDSDHNENHVLNELDAYKDFVTPGSYIIVEDTIIGGHPVQVLDKDLKPFSPGPFEAVVKFLLSNEDFVIDSSRERFQLTSNPRGYLKKRINGKQS